MTATLLDAVFAVARALESAGARFVVGGSLSSSLQGIPRSTLDGDLVTDLQDRQIATFVDRLDEGFYVDEERVREGVHRRAWARGSVAASRRGQRALRSSSARFF